MARNRQVALIFDAAKPYDRKIISGVAAYVREVGTWGLYVEEDPLERLPDLRTWQGDGIIANFDDRRVAAVRGLKVPVVGIGGGYGWYDPAMGIPYFSSDNRAIARMVAEHFIERGFTRLAYYGCPRTRVNRWSEERAEAFAERAAEAGLTCATYAGRGERARRWSELQARLCAWLAGLSRPIGIMAANDLRARHVLEACRTIGLRVPDEVAVVGVDNDEMICELTHPPLSSVEQGTRQMGYQAAALLDRLMSRRKVGRLRFVIAPQGIVTRRSSDVLAVEDSDVAHAVRFIRERACDGIRVSDVVREVAISRSTLEKRFATMLGRTLHEEIRRTRIERVRQLLTTTTLTLKEIAGKAGLRHVPFMTTLFRRFTGHTPAEYRRWSYGGRVRGRGVK